MAYKYSKRVYLGRDESGKIIRKRIHANTKVELAILEEETINEYKKHNGSIPTLSLYAHKWYNDTKQNTELNTQLMYHNLIKQIDNSLVSDKNIKDIKLEDLQHLINEHIQTPNTCKKLKMCLNGIMNYAVSNEEIKYNPCKKVIIPKSPTPERFAFTDEEIKCLKQAKLEKLDRAYVFTSYYFGLRPGEALGLKTTDFDWNNKTLIINKAVAYKEDQNTPYIKTTKTDNTRELPIPKGAFEIIRPYANSVISDENWLFTMENGGLITKSSSRKRWDRITAEWNKVLPTPIEKCRPYNMRYTYATTLYYSGITLKKAAELMGHSNTKMLLEIYAQLDSQQENMERLMNRFV